MKFSLIALVTLLGVAMATPATAKLPNGAPCKKDGSMGACDSGFCLQEASKDQGKCAPKKN